jgi:hypothetical protein
MGIPPMTADEIHTARLLRRESKTIDEIAIIMGRSRSAIGDAVKGRTIAHVHEQTERAMVIPEYVLADRDRRLAMQPRDLTALLMGDPVR